MTTRDTMQVLAKMYTGKKPSKHVMAKVPAGKPVAPGRGRSGKTYVVKGLRS